MGYISMSKHKRTVEQKIEGFLQIWDQESMIGLLSELAELFVLYDIEEMDDWLQREVGEDDTRNVRLIRTVYLISRVSELYAGRMCRSKMEFKDLWKELKDVLPEDK